MTVRNVQDNQILVGDPIADIRGGQQIVGDPIAEVGRVQAGPVALSSEQGQRAVQTSINYLTGAGRSFGIASAGRELSARSVEVDELGMTHVRMDRVYNGLKVYGEQVVTHIGRDGAVRSVSGTQTDSLISPTFNTRPAISVDRAMEIARGNFVGPPTETPRAELLVYPDSSGNYRLAYHVQMTNLSGSEPSKMNYFVDAQTGQMIDHFNALPVLCPHCKAMQTGQLQPPASTSGESRNTGVVPPHMRGGADAAAAPVVDRPRGRRMPDGSTRQVGTGSLLSSVRGGKRPVASLTATGTATPNAPIRDNQTTVSKININDDLSVTGVKVNVDIAHTYRGDLVVKLRSPEGKEVTLHNRTGGSADNLVFEANPADFNGMNSKGEWSLIVEDKAAQDEGTLKSWSLAVTGNPKTPPPPAGDIVKSVQPNTPIRDNQRIESKINIAETGNVDTLSVNVDIAHTYRGDLRVKLVSPSGKEVTLHDRTGGSADNLTFEVSRSEFANEPINGDWKLVVEDLAAQDEGTLKSWGLKIKKKDGNTPPPPPPPPSGSGTGNSLYSGQVSLGTTQNSNGTFTLTDSTRGNSRTLDANNTSSVPGSAITDNNNTWGEATDSSRQRAAIDAHYGMQLTWDFYRDVLGRSSIDGNGAALISNVHVNRNYNNAYWDGSQMSYGDGDGRTFSPLASIDVAGHEITHGLTERTAGLIYRNESGGLNEAMSDIMGTAIEWYASQRNPNVQFDWKIGEDIYTPGVEGDALRYMDDPTRDNYSIDHYSNYPRQTEVHGSSGIANNAFYLFVNGGTNRTSGLTVTGGVGMEKGAKIFYRALAFYMTPNTTFAQARQATIQAATDLYGANSTEVQKLKEAWTAVGVN